MVDRNEPVEVHGFLCGIELKADINIEDVMDHLADGVRYLEGVGDIDVNYLGQLEVIDGEQVMVRETETGFQDESDALNLEAGKKVDN